MAFPPLDRLKSNLLTSGLQTKDSALFQVINQLIDAVRQVQGVLSGQIELINNNVTNITNVTDNAKQTIIPGFDGEDGIEEFIPALSSGFTSLLGSSSGYIIKSADETVNNSSALQDDDELFFSAIANKQYLVELFLILDSGGNASADWKCNWTIPAGANLYYGPAWQSSTPYWDVFTPAGGTAASLFTGGGADFTWASGAATIQGTRFFAILVMGSTAGQVKFRWAQNTATLVNSIVKKGSTLHFQSS